MAWDEVDTESLLPDEKQHSIVMLDTMKPPFDDDAAVKDQEVDNLEEANTPSMTETIWMAYDAEGNSQVLSASQE